MVLRVGFTVVVGFTGKPSDIEEVKVFGSFETRNQVGDHSGVRRVQW